MQSHEELVEPGNEPASTPVEPLLDQVLGMTEDANTDPVGQWVAPPEDEPEVT